MKQIRFSVFETNSSSMHSVSIGKGYDEETSSLNFDDDESKVVGHFGEFGWEEEYYNDADTKLSYLLTMIAEHASTIEEFYNSDDFIAVEDVIKDKLNCDGITIPEDEYKISSYRSGETYLDINGYIDHQSMYSSIFDFLNDYNLDLEEFIFNSNVELVTDNDNH